MTDRKILRIAQVSESTGVPPSTIYEWLREKRHAHIEFPRPIKYSNDPKSRTVGWYSDEIQEWIETRPRA